MDSHRLSQRHLHAWMARVYVIRTLEISLVYDNTVQISGGGRCILFVSSDIMHENVPYAVRL